MRGREFSFLCQFCNKYVNKYVYTYRSGTMNVSRFVPTRWDFKRLKLILITIMNIGHSHNIFHFITTQSTTKVSNRFFNRKLVECIMFK
jgi:hypothetical protein